MKFKSKKIIGQQGFSLIELAIVLFIIALLLGGLLPTFSSQMELQKRNETRKLLEDVRDSLLGYVMANGRLPAPTCGTLPNTNINAGLEFRTAASAATCVTDLAVLPWVTLGISETDAWGNRLTYRVTTLFASGVAAGTSSAFVIDSPGDMTINDGAGLLVAASAPVVVVSHGPKGCGAYMPTGTRVKDSPVATPPADQCNDIGQKENVNNDPVFVSKTPSPTFDDIVIWITSNTLVNRMVVVNKLP